MRRRTSIVLALMLSFASCASARAHFLFIRIGEPAEAGRTVEVFFSERAEAGDPRFIHKVAGTVLTLQTSPGKFQPLAVRQAADRLRAFLPAGGTVSVTGRLEYGVLRREVPFLLRYYPKAISGDPKELAAFRPQPGTPLEIGASIEGDRVTLTLLRDGKPVPSASFTTVDDDLSNESVNADSAGRAVWKPPSPGFYCVYAKSVLKTPGKYQNSEYSEVREFATLAFPWPLVRTGADPQAVELFQRALAARAAWEHFPGFAADVSGKVDGRAFAGKATVGPDGGVTLDLDDDPSKTWVEDELHSIATHRMATPSDGAKPPVLRFADGDTSHPLGRLLLFEGGQFASSYRVRGDRITVVNRNFGGRNMTITVLEEGRNAEGKQLPRTYCVQYWNAQDGTLERSESFSHRWTRVGRFDLPSSVLLTAASKAGLSVRSIQLSNHRLLDAKAAIPSAASTRSSLKTQTGSAIPARSPRRSE